MRIRRITTARQSVFSARIQIKPQVTIPKADLAGTIRSMLQPNPSIENILWLADLLREPTHTVSRPNNTR